MVPLQQYRYAPTSNTALQWQSAALITPRNVARVVPTCASDFTDTKRVGQPALLYSTGNIEGPVLLTVHACMRWLLSTRPVVSARVASSEGGSAGGVEPGRW